MTHDLVQTDTLEGPAFLVGQDRAGFWLAMEASGRRGGLFATRNAALDYARAETEHRPGAVLLAPGPITFR